MKTSREHITVCICTFRRPKFLLRLLHKLQEQITEQLFTYSVVVVDNDYTQSARDLVESFTKKSDFDIRYCIEPEQNIALARNKAVENARGSLIAFIDDDEFPVEGWLLNLYKAYKKFDVDGIFGPVKPHFVNQPPGWIIKGKFCDRLSYKTGTVLDSGSCRTGNVLLKRDIFKDQSNRFDRRFGRTGGEDGQFFLKMIRQGRVFIWCDEAPVYETVPPERWKKSFYLKKYARIGGLTGELIRKESLRSHKYVLKSFIAFILFALALPFSLLFGQHIYMKCLLKAAYHFSLLSGFCGHLPIRYRSD